MSNENKQASFRLDTKNLTYKQLMSLISNGNKYRNKKVEDIILEKIKELVKIEFDNFYKETYSFLNKSVKEEIVLNKDLIRSYVREYMIQIQDRKDNPIRKVSNI